MGMQMCKWDRNRFRKDENRQKTTNNRAVQRVNTIGWRRGNRFHKTTRTTFCAIICFVVFISVFRYEKLRVIFQGITSTERPLLYFSVYLKSLTLPLIMMSACAHCAHHFKCSNAQLLDAIVVRTEMFAMKIALISSVASMWSYQIDCFSLWAATVDDCFQIGVCVSKWYRCVDCIEPLIVHCDTWCRLEWRKNQPTDRTNEQQRPQERKETTDAMIVTQNTHYSRYDNNKLLVFYSLWSPIVVPYDNTCATVNCQWNDTTQVRHTFHEDSIYSADRMFCRSVIG